MKTVRIPRITKLKGEVDRARIRELGHRVDRQRMPFFGFPWPFSPAFLRFALYAYRTKALAVFIWLIYPPLLMICLTYWLVTGLITLFMIFLCTVAIYFSRGPRCSWRFFLDSLDDYGPAGWG